MKKIAMLYSFRYTTSEGAHRYTTNGAKINIGDLYLCGVSVPPKNLKIEVELVN